MDLKEEKKEKQRCISLEMKEVVNEKNLAGYLLSPKKKKKNPLLLSLFLGIITSV